MKGSENTNKKSEKWLPILWGYRYGPVLHLVGQEKEIPVHARTRCRIYTFSSRGQLAFVAGQADLVRTLNGNRIQGASFNRFDAEAEFSRLAATGQGASQNP